MLLLIVGVMHQHVTSVDRPTTVLLSARKRMWFAIAVEKRVILVPSVPSQSRSLVGKSLY